jgi:hypothetical protein
MGGDGGVLGGVSQTLFGDGGAGAAQDAAMAQQRAAQGNYNTIKGLSDQATTQGLLSFEQDIKNQERELGRQEQLIAQIDPTIMEASQQALKLLRGESSSTLKPVQDQRNMQRQQLVNRLREQMGPGAETSTAGIQALNRFDSETNNLVSGQQQGALSLLGNTANQFSALRPNMNQSIGLRSQYGQGGTNLRMNQAALLNGAYQPVINSAGAEHTAAVMRGKQDLAFGNALLEGGIAYATGGASTIGKKLATFSSDSGGGDANAGVNYFNGPNPYARK